MAALTIPDTGLGATVSGFGMTTLIKKIGDFEIGVDVLDITCLGDTGFKKNRSSDLRNNPEVTIEFFWTGAAQPTSTNMVTTTEPYAGTTYTITFPAAGSFAGTAFCKSVKFPSCAPGEVMMGSMTVVFDGATGPAFTAA